MFLLTMMHRDGYTIVKNIQDFVLIQIDYKTQNKLKNEYHRCAQH